MNAEKALAELAEYTAKIDALRKAEHDLQKRRRALLRKLVARRYLPGGMVVDYDNAGRPWVAYEWFESEPWGMPEVGAPGSGGDVGDLV